MKILKLYEHKKNPGGIVNLQLDMEKFFEFSEHQYIYFRTGKIFKHPIWSKKLFRIIDIISSYLFFPFFLLINRPDSIEINTSFIRKSFLRDFIYLSEAMVFSRRSKKVVFIHGWSESYKSEFIKKFGTIYRSFNLFSDKIIVLSLQFSESLINSGTPPDKIEVMTTGINFKDFEARQKVTPVYPHILFMSRLALDKGIMEFLEAIPFLLQYNEKLHFDIAGTGDAEADLLKSKIYTSYRSNITFHGYLKDSKKIELLKKSSIFVFPSSHGEGFPVSILEAMASSLPLVFTSSGGLLDHLKNGINGLEIPAKNIQAIVQAVIKLLENPKLMADISKTNLEEAKSKFDIQKIFYQIEKIHTMDCSKLLKAH